MKLFKILCIFLICFLTIGRANAVQFEVVVLPTDIFNVCDNYFCFPEASEIAADYIIKE